MWPIMRTAGRLVAGSTICAGLLAASVTVASSPAAAHENAAAAVGGIRAATVGRPPRPRPDPAPTGRSLILDRTDGGRRFRVDQGTTVVVRLSGDSLDWSAVTSASPRVLQPVTSVPGQQVFRARAAGQGVLVATGRPRCAPGEACPQFVVQWRVVIDVVASTAASPKGDAPAVASPAIAVSAAGPALGAFQAHGSVEQIWVIDGRPGATFEVLAPGGRVLARHTADAYGSALFRGLPPGRGYRVRQRWGGRSAESGELTVLTDRPAPPSNSLYDQILPVDPVTDTGYGYITTRDGTKLSAYVHLPGPPDKGPYPTVVEYSGYDPSNPDQSPTGPEIASHLAQLLGFATVGVNIRGTGCSGGAYDFFEPLQDLDGYDVIETVAHQPWVLDHKVGMVGISYPGISQLFVAQTDPPALEAIAPLSVLASTTQVVYPGGIFNDGFAQNWIESLESNAAPGGESWSAARIAAGDTVCAANQKLRLQAPNFLEFVEQNRYYTQSVAAPRDPINFVDKIKVPTFIACQFEDEQVGPSCPSLVRRFTGTSKVWFTFTNGDHVDSLDPGTIESWYDFLELFVAHRAPHLPAAVRALAPALYAEAMPGATDVQLPPDPVEDHSTYAGALAAFEARPKVTVAFDNGAGAAPGDPVPGFTTGFSSFPVPGTVAQTWYLGPDGTLSADRPRTAGADAWDYDPGARPARDIVSTSDQAVWAAQPDWDWTELVPGKAVAYVTPPLAHDEVLVGTGSLDIWLKSNAPDTDLQVTVSEVEPDGKEEYVQDGWLRASFRALDVAASTVLDPVPTFTRSGHRLLHPGAWTEVRVPIEPMGHVFRAGSRIRISIEAPGGDTPAWSFADLADTYRGHPVVDEVARTPTMDSRVVLPLVPGVKVPAPLPACGALRGEPCRAYVPLPDTPAPVGRTG